MAKIKVYRFVNGSQGELETLGVIERRISAESAMYPEKDLLVSKPLQYRVYHYIDFMNNKWPVTHQADPHSDIRWTLALDSSIDRHVAVKEVEHG